MVVTCLGEVVLAHIHIQVKVRGLTSKWRLSSGIYVDVIYSVCWSNCIHEFSTVIKDQPVASRAWLFDSLNGLREPS